MENNPEFEKKLNYYMSLPYEVAVTPSPEGGYAARVLDLPGCITQGETLQEVFEMIEDAKLCWISSQLEYDEEVPEPHDPLKLDGRLHLRIPRSLHKKLSKCAAREGVNVNQLAIYLMASGLGERFTEDKQN